MPNPIRDFFLGTVTPKGRDLVEALSPRRTFDDVILPQSTRSQLDHALNQIRKRDLIFGRWGLGERHATGLGLAFNFAGPPGTGKTICAEAIAHALNKKLLVVRYSEMESLWAGETGKNVAAVFHSASEQDAVLFFDEADAIAGRRFAHVTQGYQREANTVVNVLLKELEEFDGVVIFATNLAANFDPAFELRVRTHILFEMPGPKERAAIWKVQLHERKTPLAEDVNFEILGEKYAVAGGDIKNAVLKAAQIATSEPGPDAEKKIHQRHFEQGMSEVLASKKVMEQTLFTDGDGSHSSTALAGLNGAWQQMAQSHQTLEEQVDELAVRLAELEQHTHAFPSIIERFDDAARASQSTLRAEIIARVDVLQKAHDEFQTSQTAFGNQSTLRLQTLADDMAAIRDGSQQLQARIETLNRTLQDQETARAELQLALTQAGERQSQEIVRYQSTLSTHQDELESTKMLLLQRWRNSMLLGGAAFLLSIAGVIIAAVR